MQLKRKKFNSVEDFNKTDVYQNFSSMAYDDPSTFYESIYFGKLLVEAMGYSVNEKERKIWK